MKKINKQIGKIISQELLITEDKATYSLLEIKNDITLVKLYNNYTYAKVKYFEYLEFWQDPFFVPNDLAIDVSLQL